MKPDETPAPPEGYRILTEEEKHHPLPVDTLFYVSRDGTWTDSTRARIGRLADPERIYATRTSVPPTESASIGSKSVVEGQSGEPMHNCDFCGNTRVLQTAGGYVPCHCTRPHPVSEAPSAGEVPTPRTDAIVEKSKFQNRLVMLITFARQLERETIALREQLVEAQSQLANEQHYSGLLKTAHEKSLESDSPVGACHCLTKSPDILYHKPGCKYRLITERNEARQQLAAEQANAKSWRKGMEDMTHERDAAIARAEKAEAFANRVERGESSFKAAMDEQLKRISQLPTGKTADESLADAVERCLAQLSTLRKAVEEIAELEGDCENQQFKLSRFQVSQIARAALNAEGGR